jgi:hypothetical protein
LRNNKDGISYFGYLPEHLIKVNIKMIIGSMFDWL